MTTIPHKDLEIATENVPRLQLVNALSSVRSSGGRRGIKLALEKIGASKQREERVPGVPGLRKITYLSGKAVWYFRFDDPVTRKRSAVRLGDLNSVPYMG